MLKLSRNNQNIKMFGVPPNTLPLVIYIHRDILFIGYYYITTCLSKQLPVEIMVLSDGMVHFLKIETNKKKSTKTILWLGINTVYRKEESQLCIYTERQNKLITSSG